jgi:hypothetical protein
VEVRLQLEHASVSIPLFIVARAVAVSCMVKACLGSMAIYAFAEHKDDDEQCTLACHKSWALVMNLLCIEVVRSSIRAGVAKKKTAMKSSAD